MDMITYLPDCLLILIISLLPFKEAVRTSILSSRWRNLFRATKNIDFDESFFVKDQFNPFQRSIQRRDFLTFANNFIQNYSEPNIEKLSVSFSFPVGFREEIESFISFASARNVKSLVVNFNGPVWNRTHGSNIAGMLPLPMSAYENVGLEMLHLSSCKIRMPEFLRFASLKKLTLECIKLKSIKDLISNCRVLEFLHLKECKKIRILDISALELQHLIVENCSIFEYINIEAPKLRCLQYRGDYKVMIFRGRHDAMEVAEFDYGSEESFYYDGDNFICMIKEMHTVTDLKVCSYMLQSLATAMEVSFTPPLEVRQLTLKSTMHEFEFYGISMFLMGCPFLEFLTIDVGPRSIMDDYELPENFSSYFYWIHPEIIVADCVANTLKVVLVSNFKGTRNELQILSYILKYGVVLEKVYLIISKEEDSNGGCMQAYLRKVERLLRYERASSNVNICWCTEY